MQPPKDKVKDVTFDDTAHIRLSEGIQVMRKAVGSTYGPGGRNVLIKKAYVQPIITRDGVTVARDIAGYGHRLKDPIASEAAKLVYQASEKTNKTGGDGTSATVITLADLYSAGRQLVAAGQDPMLIRKQIFEARDIISDFVKGKSKEVDAKMLRQVAEVSSGDPALAEMLSDLVWKTGLDGQITLSYHNAPYVEVEDVTGYMLPNGYRHLQHEVELEDPLVFVSQKTLKSKQDIIPVLEIAEKSQRQIVIVADVVGSAGELMLWAIANQKVDGVIIPPPAFGQDGHDYFEDIAIYTGSRLWLESDSFAEITPDAFGTAIRSARISRERAVLFGDNTTGDKIASRIAEINTQKQRSDITPGLMEVLELRTARLAGKVSIVKVGAVTEQEREELFFRVEDAVEACKSALEMGVVAGGATTLLFASELPGLEPFIAKSLKDLFHLLMSNAGHDAGFYLQQVLKAGYGKGYNLRKMTDTPVDLYKEGVLDATKVVLQTVKNAFSEAGGLLTVGATITEEEVDVEPQKQA